MNWRLYDEQYQEWGEVVVKQRLQEHADKVASNTELGHVKIDNKTIVTDSNGVIKVNDSLASNLTRNIILNVGTTVQQGRVTEAFFPLPFNCSIRKINMALITPSSSDIVFNLQTTSDFQTYTNVFQNDLTLSANSHLDTYDVNGIVSLSENQVLFLNIISSANDAKNLVMNITVEKQ